jgi:predicted Zn-dependent peptidase
MPRASRFNKTVFPNGLTLVTERVPEVRSLSMGAWVKTGTRHESPQEAGVSHFLEHMLFKGTKKRSALDIAREVDRVGGDFNAFTAREHTCFHLLLLDRDAGLGTDILADVILNSSFASEELERERKVILQEIAMVDESPEELAHDLYYENIFPQHGLGRPILGTERSIRKMKRQDVLGYFKRHYRPDQLVISVTGDISHEAVRRKLGPLIRAKWPGRPGKSPKNPGLGPKPEFKHGTWWSVRNTEQVHLVWGMRGPEYTSRDRFAAYLLNVHLGGGMSSSLFQEIREKNGLAYTVYSSLSPFDDTGVFSVYAATGPSQVPLCLRLIEQCVERVRKDRLSTEELEISKDNLKGTILLSADNVESRMSSIARNEIVFGRYIGVDEVCREIDAVTPEQIRRLARQLLGDGSRAVLAMGPKPSAAVRAKLGNPTIIK